MVYARFSPKYQRLALRQAGASCRGASIRACRPILLAMVVVGRAYAGVVYAYGSCALGFRLPLLHATVAVLLRSLSWQGFKEAVYGSMVNDSGDPA